MYIYINTIYDSFLFAIKLLVILPISSFKFIVSQRILLIHVRIIQKINVLSKNYQEKYFTKSLGLI